VALARALINRPALLLADEPTSALDDANTAALFALLIDTAKAEGAALLIATHDRRVLEAVDIIYSMRPAA
jgi:putative ABC transport system ATP-binding protein